MIKVVVGIALVALVGCGSAPESTPDSGPDETAIVQCEAVAASLCAHCCEVQPYVDETKDGTLFTRPISACSSSPLPDPISGWSVSWCMSDCEAAAVAPCGGAP